MNRGVSKMAPAVFFTGIRVSGTALHCLISLQTSLAHFSRLMWKLLQDLLGSTKITLTRVQKALQTVPATPPAIRLKKNLPESQKKQTARTLRPYGVGPVKIKQPLVIPRPENPDPIPALIKRPQWSRTPTPTSTWTNLSTSYTNRSCGWKKKSVVNYSQPPFPFLPYAPQQTRNPQTPKPYKKIHFFFTKKPTRPSKAHSGTGSGRWGSQTYQKNALAAPEPGATRPQAKNFSSSKITHCVRTWGIGTASPCAWSNGGICHIRLLSRKIGACIRCRKMLLLSWTGTIMSLL